MFDKETMDTIVKGAFMNAMGEDRVKKVMEDIVTRLLTTKVNSNGQETYNSFGGQPNTPYLDYLINGEVKHMLEQAVRDHVRNNLPELKEAIHKAIVSSDGLADGILKMITSQLTDGYVKIDISIDKH